jgi:signal recognition particle subunit SRP54
MFDSLTNKFTAIFDRLGGKQKLTEKNIGEACDEVRTALLDADVNFRVVRQFVKRVREKALGTEVIPGVTAGQIFIKIVQDEIEDLLGPTDSSIYFNPNGPTVILMAGLQGAGKTTTCAKLADFLRSKHGRHPMMVAADVQRPAAIEQLKVLGGQIDIPVYAEEDGAAPPDICEHALTEARKTGRDTVILDTAGRLHIDDALMEEIRQVRDRTRPHEIFLVCDAMVGQDAVNSAREFNESLEISGVIMTKLDGDARGGAALSVKHVTGKTIKFAGVSEKIDGLEPFYPDRMAQRILGMGDIASLVEEARKVFDQEQAQKQAEKMLAGDFTLEDMLVQFDQVQQMASGKGGMSGLLRMLPGASRMLQGADELDDKDFGRMKAIIQSMTKVERKRPELIDYSRRRRIARGSGVEEREVSQVLKQHREMKKIFSGRSKFFDMFKGLMGGGMPGMGGGGGVPGMEVTPEMAQMLKQKAPKTKTKSRKDIRKERKKRKRKRK